jgi:hypothetical protein
MRIVSFNPAARYLLRVSDAGPGSAAGLRSGHFGLLSSRYERVELIKRIRERRPNLPAVLLTGSREPAVLESARRLAHCSSLHKRSTSKIEKCFIQIGAAPKGDSNRPRRR